jgi:hypothetical protein
MNNRVKLLIIAASLFLVVLVIFFSIISKSFKFGTSTNINPTPVETRRYETATTRKINSMTLAQKRREAKKMASETENLLTNIQKESLKKLKELVKSQKKGILETEDFNLGYSDLKNQFYVQKKSPQALEKLKNFLSTNNVLDIYTQDPYFFVLTDEDLQTYILEQEEQRINEWEETENETGGSTSTGGTGGTTGTGGTEGTTGGTGGTTGTGGTGGTTGGTGGTTGTGGTGGTSGTVGTGGTEGTSGTTSNNITQAEELAYKQVSAAKNILKAFTTYNIGKYIEQPTSPPIITTNPVTGIVNPPNLGSPNSLGYYLLPVSTNGSYQNGGWGTCESHKWGSKELIGVITTVADRWHLKYASSKFVVGDLSGMSLASGTYCGHQTHGVGINFDLMPSGSPKFCETSASVEVNIELGKMFLDTGIVDRILIGGVGEPSSATTVRNAWKDYANSKGLYYESTVPSGISHLTHCDIRIASKYALPEWRPSSCCN